MREQDHDTFQKLMDRAAIVTVLQNGRDFNDLKTALFLALQEYTLEQVTVAVAEHCRASRFFPMLADIVTRIEGNVEDRAALAWSLVRKTIRRYGTGRNIRFPHPAIHYALDKMGGWWSLNRLLDSDNEPWKFREFARFYRLGEKHASWTGEHGKEKVLPYLPSEHGLGRQELPLKVYDAETGELIDNKIFALEAPKSPECAIIQMSSARTGFLTA
ncbi:MAG: hypothetical protein IJU98_11030 [Synergistaceae bacterium]|nr:hypothetical protein [Synergistaceae bacterium]